MSNKSSSSTSRTYNTTNLSQQGEGNVAGDGNRVTIERADALALEKIAETLGDGVEDLSEAGIKQTEAALTSNTDVTKAALSFTEKASMDAMDFVSSFTEREQVGNAAEATKTVMWVAAVAGVTLVGIAWASKGVKA